MRNLIINNGALIIWAIAILETIIGILSVTKGKGRLRILVAAMCFGLAADAFIQAMGTLIGEGAFLGAISQIRYLLHGILVPCLIPISFITVGWMKKRTPSVVVWGATAVVMAMGIAMGFMTKTTPVEYAGVLRYAQAPETPAFASSINRLLSIGGVIPLIVLGIVHIVKDKKAWMFLSGFFMFAFSALAPATGNMDLNFIITLFGELLMVLFLHLEGTGIEEEA